MSGNAALAAAKRRRNPGSGNMVDQFNQHEVVPEVRKEYNIQSLVAEHDFKIFKLEKLVSSGATPSSGANTNGEQMMGAVNNAENLAKANAVELRLLKTTVQKQTKMQQETNSLLITLRATLNTQTAEINTLRSQNEEFYASKKLEDNASQVSEDNLSTGPVELVTDVGNMNLEVLEKDD